MLSTSLQAPDESRAVGIADDETGRGTARQFEGC